MAKKCMKKRLFEQAKEIEIQTEPQTIMPMVDEVAKELCSHNFYYEARGSPSQQLKRTFIGYNVLVMETGKVGAIAKQPIGAFTLQSLGSNRTMLTVLPRSRWGDGNLTPTELAILAYNVSHYDEYFVQFIKRLDERLAHYGLRVTWYKRLWRVIKELLEIAKVIKP